MLENPGDRAFLEGDLPGPSRTDGLPRTVARYGRSRKIRQNIDIFRILGYYV
jgi:hypothetical protein